MPYSITKTSQGYGVKNTSSGKMHSSHSTKANAEAQFRLLEGVEHGSIRTTSQAMGMGKKSKGGKGKPSKSSRGGKK